MANTYTNLESAKTTEDNSSQNFFNSQKERIVLIGMPGSGKSTLAQGLGQSLGWLFIDTDSLLEAWYGVLLEDLKNTLGLTYFLKAEEKMILSLNVERCIVATGGSVIYSPEAMHYLKNTGLLVYLKIDYQTLVQRISDHPRRGLIIRSGQRLADIYRERTPKYESWADFSLQTDNTHISQCIQKIKDWYYELIKSKTQKGV